jgi:hypothetical protein
VAQPLSKEQLDELFRVSGKEVSRVEASKTMSGDAHERVHGEERVWAKAKDYFKKVASLAEDERKNRSRSRHSTRHGTQ